MPSSRKQQTELVGGYTHCIGVWSQMIDRIAETVLLTIQQQ